MNIPIIAKLKGKFSKKNSVKIVTEGYRITRHWVALLVGTGVLFLVSAALIFYIYISYVAPESRDEVTPSQNSATIDREKLQNIIQEFKNKEARFKDTLQNAPNIVDPSL